MSEFATSSAFIVTGASRGIGDAIVQGGLNEGRVLTLDIKSSGDGM